MLFWKLSRWAGKFLDYLGSYIVWLRMFFFIFNLCPIVTIFKLLGKGKYLVFRPRGPDLKPGLPPVTGAKALSCSAPRIFTLITNIIVCMMRWVIHYMEQFAQFVFFVLKWSQTHFSQLFISVYPYKLKSLFFCSVYSLQWMC